MRDFVSAMHECNRRKVKYIDSSTDNHFKLNEYTFTGSNSVIFIFDSLFNGDQLLKEIICSSRSKFFPLRVDLL